MLLIVLKCKTENNLSSPASQKEANFSNVLCYSIEVSILQMKTVKKKPIEQAAQGSGEVPIPGGVQKTCRYGTSGHGLAGVVLCGWLDLMILEVFSNFNDSVILRGN